jgi:BlaI family penicillinase repressor
MKKLRLTELQLELMRVIWRRGAATAADVHRALGSKRGFAQSTVATLLRRLEKKGALTHDTLGRQFVYRPAVSSDTVRRSMLRELAERLLPTEVPELLNHLFAARKIGADEIEQVKKLIEEKEREERKR